MLVPGPASGRRRALSVSGFINQVSTMNITNSRRGHTLSHTSHPTSRAARRAAALLLIPAAIMAPQMATACATCGRTLSADAATGYSAPARLRLHLEYHFIYQDP